MITIRKSEARGKANFGWLDTKHTFSFGNYYDPNFMGFANLRVINEDKIKAGNGFGTHGHQDMEIITYVIEGTLEHQDSIGNGSSIIPHEVQRMSAGTGIQHSEKNNSTTEDVHLLQIWIQPDTLGLSPSYEQKKFSAEEKRDNLCLIASKDGIKNSVLIHQDVNIYSSFLSEKKELNYLIDNNRCVWIQVVKGSLFINENSLSSGDGVAITEEDKITIKSISNNTEFLLFDLKK